VRVLIAYESLVDYAGTETYILTIARQLLALGHEVVVYARTLGPMADFMRAEKIAVIGEADALPEACDAVLAQDAASAYEMRDRYPDAACVCTVHSRGFALSIPPQVGGICGAVVVFNDRVRRFVEQAAFHAPIVRLRQPIELKRFGVLGRQSTGLHRALVLSNYLRGPQAQLLKDACANVGAELVTVGAHGAPMARPEHAIADADMVFGLGRSILEAMAGRRAAYVYGVAGVDGWVTPDNYAGLEADGFAGQVSGDVPSLGRLTADLRSWSPAMGVDNRALALQHGTSDHVAELVALLRDLGAPKRQPLNHHEELARLVRLEWDVQSRLRAVVEENRTLRARVEDLSREGTDVRTALAAREEAAAAVTHKLNALRATRRFRLASGLAAPLDRARTALVRARAKRQAGPPDSGH
jgi:hypothetical protein